MLFYMRFTRRPCFGVWFGGIKCVHAVVQPSPPPVLKALESSRTDSPRPTTPPPALAGRLLPASLSLTTPRNHAVFVFV